MKDVWIGLVGASGPLRGNVCLGDAKGAYLNALALVSTSEEYREAVTDCASRELALFPFEFDEIERFGDRLARMTHYRRASVPSQRETRRSGRVTFDHFSVHEC